MTDNEKRLAEALRDCVAEMHSVLASLNAEQMPHDGDEFHERLGAATKALAAHDAAQQAGSVGLTDEDLCRIREKCIDGGYNQICFARAAIAEFCRLNNYPLPKE